MMKITRKKLLMLEGYHVARLGVELWEATDKAVDIDTAESAFEKLVKVCLANRIVPVIRYKDINTYINENTEDD